MAALPVHLDFAIGDSPLCREARALGLERFGALAEHVRALPYRRTRDAHPAAVLREHCGTCSSKHRLLAQVAHQSGCRDIELAAGIYEMSERNTPGVGAVLAAAALPCIPEAHSYLRAGAVRLDLTGLAAGEISVFDSLREERCLDPGDPPAVKARWHKQFLRRWARARNLDPAEVWRVREACIAALTREDIALP